MMVTSGDDCGRYIAGIWAPSVERWKLNAGELPCWSTAARQFTFFAAVHLLQQQI